MYKITYALLFIILLSLDINAVFAQTELEIIISKNENGDLIIDDSSPIGDSKQAKNIDNDKSLTIKLTCLDSVDCKQLNVYLTTDNDGKGVAGNALQSETSSANWRFLPDHWRNKPQPMIALMQKKADSTEQEILKFPLSPSQGSDSNSDQENQTIVPEITDANINTLVTTNCTSIIQSAKRGIGNPYLASENVAYFIIDPLGNVHLRPTVIIDENDIIKVQVAANTELISSLKIRRTSSFRTPGTLNIIGGDQSLPTRFEQKSSEDLNECGLFEFELTDFQPGRAVVNISVVGEKDEVETGSFDFGVNTLYSGAFSLGAINTQLRNPIFGLVAANSDTLITEIEDGSPRTLYTLTYTPFIWGKRDIEKGFNGLGLERERFNPMFGLVLNDIDKNFVVGISYDLASAVYISAGIHFGKIKKLDPESGLEVGDVFSGSKDDIPTVKEWDNKYFIGVSLDLRAATQFLNKALSAGSN